MKNKEFSSKLSNTISALMFVMRFNSDLSFEYRKSGSKIEMSIVTYSDTFMYQIVQQHTVPGSAYKSYVQYP